MFWQQALQCAICHPLCCAATDILFTVNLIYSASVIMLKLIHHLCKLYTSMILTYIQYCQRDLTALLVLSLRCFCVFAGMAMYQVLS